jgi:hypothetical protein
MYTTPALVAGVCFVAGAIFGSIIMGLLRVAKKVSPPQTSRAAATQQKIYERIKNALEDFNASRVQAAGLENFYLNEIYVISCIQDDERHAQGILQIEVHKNQIKIQSSMSPDPRGRPLDYKTRLDEDGVAKIINDATIFIGETYTKGTKPPE